MSYSRHTWPASLGRPAIPCAGERRSARPTADSSSSGVGGLAVRFGLSRLGRHAELPSFPLWAGPCWAMTDPMAADATAAGKRTVKKSRRNMSASLLEIPHETREIRTGSI